MPDIDNRVTHLEFRADAQAREISALHSTQEVFSGSLDAIQKTLLQIKYALYGAAGMYLLSTLGLKETILQFIK